MPRLEVEALLHWVYRDELPKPQHGLTWAGGAGWSSEFVPIDTSRNYEHSTYPVNAGPPHPDALAVDHAVRSGIGLVDIPWSDVRELLMGDYANYMPGAPMILKLGVNALALVLMHSQMGTRPPWDIGQIVQQPVGGKQPKIFFVLPDGTPTTGSKRAGYYAPGACCKLEHEPSLDDVAEARAEYFAWWCALDRIVGLVSTLRLESTKAEPPRAAPTPWHTGETDKRNVLADKASVSALANHVDSRRLIPRRLSTTIGPPKKSARASPMRHIKPDTM